MRLFRFLFTAAIVLLSLLFSACIDEVSPEPRRLVVEGWIESGEYPVVIVSYTVPVSKQRIPIDSLSKYVERWARVEVSDGEHTVVLTGRADRTRPQGYLYTTTDLRGVPGREYTLRVEAGAFQATAHTTIPYPCAFEQLTARPVTAAGDLFTLEGVLRDTVNHTAYYKLFAATYGIDEYAKPAYLGNFTNEDFLLREATITINPPQDQILDYTPYFKAQSVVRVKLARMDSTAYSFWHSLEQNAELGRNPLFPYTENLKGNVAGAEGYWIGYGITTRTALIH